MSAFMRFVAIACLVAMPAAAQAQRTFALVIGIDNYSYVMHLDGARNDAADLTQALKKSGATRVVTLLDRDATKANVTAAWQSLITEAEPGDVIFLTYAGHGAQIPERVKGDEQDHLDEFWVLTGFNPKDVRGTFHETIFDNELSGWLSEAARHELRVVLVADSCHAGGMARSVTGKVRFVDLGKSRLLGELFAAMQKGSGAVNHTAPNANSGAEVVAEPAGQALPKGITLLAATPEALPVPEVAIDGHARGALSWSVARAIEGKADRNGDGVITRNELEDYVMANVRMRSEALQTPVFTPVASRSADELIMPVQAGEQMKVASEVASPPGGHVAPVARELGFLPVLPVTVTGSIAQLPDTIKADFAYQWDATKGTFKTPNGDVAAEHVSAFTVNDVVSKFILLDFLKAVGSRNPGQMTIAPQKSLYLAGDHIKFSAVRGRYANMVVFNLANSGEVQFLDLMINGEATGKQFLQEMQVVSPFGSDHLVTIASNEPLEPIGRALQRGVTPKELLQILSTRIDGTDSAVAITPIYTRGK
jgi:uncharacterized caspase-like protein